MSPASNCMPSKLTVTSNCKSSRPAFNNLLAMYCAVTLLFVNGKLNEILFIGSFGYKSAGSICARSNVDELKAS